MTVINTGYPSKDKPWLKYYSKDAIDAPLPQNTLYEYLMDNNRDHPTDIAINYMGRKITYGEFFERIDETASAFTKAGVKEKDIVTVALPSIPEALYCVYALNRIGAVANMIHPLAGGEETANYINEVKSKIAVIFDGAYESVKDHMSGTSVEQVIVASPGDSLPMPLKIVYSLKVKSPKLDGKLFWKWAVFIKDGAGASFDTVIKDPYQAAIISHTGGTTGEPKGVMCSDAGLNALMWQILCNFEYERQEISLAVLPPFVNYSLIEAMMAMLAAGFQVVLIPDYKPLKFAEYVRKYRPNEVLSIPAYWEAMLKIPGIEKTDLSSLKHLYFGGEAMSPDVESEINRVLTAGGSTTELCKGLGSTEMGAAATQSYPGCNPIGSVGIPLVKTNCKIVDPGTTDELSCNEEGEICFSGPTMMIGYYNNPDATDEMIRIHDDGERWLHTGDIGYLDEDGVLFVTGRMKRIIMTKGRDGQITKFFPDRIEQVICGYPSVDLCCVIGIPDEDRINYPKAIIVLKNGIKETDVIKQGIIDRCRDMMPEYMVPEDIEFRKNLPRTERGKVDYRVLEHEYIK